MVRRTLLVGAIAGALFATACTDAISPESSPSAEPTLQPLPVAPTEPADHGGGEVETDDDGNVLKELGEAGGLLADDGETIVFQVSVNAVSRESTCDGRLVQETPENGSFLFVEMSADLDREISSLLPESAETSVPFTHESFRVLLEDGSEFRDVGTAPAWGCLEQDALLPLFIYPGESASGIVVLDAPADAVAVVYDPYGTGGWSWRLE